MKTREVVKYFGNKSKTAEILKTSRSAISQWGDYVPESRIYEIEVKTHGALKSNFTIEYEKKIVTQRD